MFFTKPGLIYYSIAKRNFSLNEFLLARHFYGFWSLQPVSYATRHLYRLCADSFQVLGFITIWKLRFEH